MNLGARVGKFKDGVAMYIPPHNLPMSLIGLMMIIVGFFGFLGGCIIFNGGDTGVITSYSIHYTKLYEPAKPIRVLKAKADRLVGLP